MQKINKQAAEIFNKMIELMNGEDHLKIDNTEGTFMPVHIEKLYDKDLAGRKVGIYSVAHYYEQNGDLVPDPDMTFAVSKVDPMYIWPMSYQNIMTYQESLWCGEDDKWKINKRVQGEHAVFAGQWMKNIKDQQF